MDDVKIILKYRAREFFNAAIKFNNVWLSLFLLLYIPAFAFFMYNFFSEIINVASAVNHYGKSGRWIINSLFLFSALIISFFLEN
ncbi:MAG TPA: hypothetical protein PKK26_09275, partial [Candidatus Wallbacteria bacterium]|nr:hypothetical protein [Candidatus Wallbacteria bacterium]